MNRLSLKYTFYGFILLFLSGKQHIYGQSEPNKSSTKPNVIFILTDDQGIGDLACHGNPWLKTPHIDKLYKESIRLTDFHVSPVCTPSRSSLMTGQYPINNGAWATFKGRAALNENATTIAEIFQNNGYVTAMYGKWHLGNNYPSRPTDMGFEYVIQHSFGGIGEITDYWGNDYFDDVYLSNNNPQGFKGYCTDIWFEESMNFIKDHKDQPFFLYIPTNAAHAPLNVDEKYAAPYKHLEGSKIPSANFYGMIANIDENIGKLNSFLKENNLDENTIVIFATDNGSQFGNSKDGSIGYNMGYRGQKGDVEEAGHRVPFFIKWPNGDLGGGLDVDVLSSGVDLLPTLSGLCKLNLPKDLDLDGIDLSNALYGKNDPKTDRIVYIHSNQDWRPPEPLINSCIMKANWRLLHGKELYDIENDPLQSQDVSSNFPEVVQSLLSANDIFISAAKEKKAYQKFPYEIVDNSQQTATLLTIQNAIGDDGPLWEQAHIAKGIKNKNNTYAVTFSEKGTYQISCRRWPEECSGSITGVPSTNPDNQFTYKAISPEKIRINVFDKSYEKPISTGSKEVLFELELQAGETMLSADFIEGAQTYGVYYTYIKRIN